MTIDLTRRVAIVTGAGGGLGRCHALALARHGAYVVVNDPGTARDGNSESDGPARSVANEIIASGGQAIVSTADVTNPEAMVEMVEMARAQWGRVDILVNNAGILRDRTFAKMDLVDFRAVIDVHLMGSVNATKAVWPVMSEQGHGRIVMTTSSSGLYGNFGQSSYSAAKMALVGLMKTLSMEGKRYGIHVNCIAPIAATRMTKDLLDAAAINSLTPEAVSPAVIALCADEAPSGVILCAGGGSVEASHVTLTRGIRIDLDDEDAAASILERLPNVFDRTGETIPLDGSEQTKKELESALASAEAL